MADAAGSGLGRRLADALAVAFVAATRRDALVVGSAKKSERGNLSVLRAHFYEQYATKEYDVVKAGDECAAEFGQHYDRAHRRHRAAAGARVGGADSTTADFVGKLLDFNHADRKTEACLAEFFPPAAALLGARARAYARAVPSDSLSSRAGVCQREDASCAAEARGLHGAHVGAGSHASRAYARQRHRAGVTASCATLAGDLAMATRNYLIRLAFVKSPVSELGGIIMSARMI